MDKEGDNQFPLKVRFWSKSRKSSTSSFSHEMGVFGMDRDLYSSGAYGYKGVGSSGQLE